MHHNMSAEERIASRAAQDDTCTVRNLNATLGNGASPVQNQQNLNNKNCASQYTLGGKSKGGKNVTQTYLNDRLNAKNPHHQGNGNREERR